MREPTGADRSIYTFNGNQKKLLIFIEGSGLNSVLGVKKNNRWESVQFGYFLANNPDNEFTLAIPEKLDFEAGKDYKNDKNALKQYTVDNLSDSHARKIDRYIDATSFDAIYLLGASEGGLLAPKIVNALRNKSKIRKMIVWGAGGYSQEECFRILALSKIPMPESYRKECERIDEIKKEIASHPDSIDTYYLGWPYARWSSFFDYRPIDEYLTINIPILFIQGLEDYNSPYESVKYVEATIHNEKYEYNYYEHMGHVLNDTEKTAEIIRSLYLWLKT